MTLYKGRCHGGPIHGWEITSRKARGVLLADKPGGRAWLYDWRDGAYHVREAEPRNLDSDRAVQAALGGDFDVIAYQGEVGDGG